MCVCLMVRNLSQADTWVRGGDDDLTWKWAGEPH